MRVLALEPYYGGSHRAFLDGWRTHSQHHFELLTLPACHWKWRMRHAAITLAQQLESLPAQTFDVMFCSSMLNLAEWSALCPRSIANLPRVCYFHENQLEYPAQHPEPRDVHFAFTQYVSALAADEVWFNSRYNRDSFCRGLRSLIRKMPDQRDLRGVERIDARAHIEAPGIELLEFQTNEQPELHILWAARWEHDKGPEDFFAALELIDQAQVPFRLSVVGEKFSTVPDVFEVARRRFAKNIVQFGFVADQSAYGALLGAANVVVSTARHEFFGLAVLEACAAGCVPLLPQRLVYPELFHEDAFIYDGSVNDLARALSELAAAPSERRARAQRARQVAETFAWAKRAPALDAALLRASVAPERRC